MGAGLQNPLLLVVQLGVTTAMYGSLQLPYAPLTLQSDLVCLYRWSGGDGDDGGGGDGVVVAGLVIAAVAVLEAAHQGRI